MRLRNGSNEAVLLALRLGDCFIGLRNVLFQGHCVTKLTLALPLQFLQALKVGLSCTQMSFCRGKLYRRILASLRNGIDSPQRFQIGEGCIEVRRGHGDIGRKGPPISRSALRSKILQVTVVTGHDAV